ncbi:MAG: YncE family protein [Acidobacteria bacterium]|nr:YncE family protein [Acidobacteriota bacterium]
MLRLLGVSLLLPFLLAAAPALLVVQKGSSTVAFYTLEGKLLSTVPVGTHPHEVAVSTDGKFAYVTDNGTMKIEQAGRGGNSVSIIDIPGRRLAGKISTKKYRRPHGIALDPKTGYLAVTTELPDRLLHIDPVKRDIIRHFDTKGKTSHMVALPAGERGAEYAFVSNAGLENVTVVQLTTGQVKSIAVGERPEGSVLSPHGKELYVCNRESASISIIDVARQVAIGLFKTGGTGPVRAGVTPDGRTLVYALMQSRKIEFADLALRRPVAQVSVDGEPVSLSVSKDGKWAFVGAQDQDRVFVISVPERKLIRTFSTERGAGPDPVVLVDLP